MFKQHQVTDVETVTEFVNQYYKRSKIEPHLKDYPDYKSLLINSREEDIKECGYTIISHHDSVTGSIVSLYK